MPEPDEPCDFCDDEPEDDDGQCPDCGAEVDEECDDDCVCEWCCEEDEDDDEDA